MNDATRQSAVAEAPELRFECQRSGNCCRRPGYVYFTRDDIDAAAGFLGIARGEFVKRYLAVDGRRFVLEVDAGGCRFFDGAGCVIHPAKPLQCRSWPFWPELVRTPRAWRAAARGCPGMGQGGAISAAELDAWLNALSEAGIPEEPDEAGP